MSDIEWDSTKKLNIEEYAKHRNLTKEEVQRRIDKLVEKGEIIRKGNDLYDFKPFYESSLQHLRPKK